MLTRSFVEREPAFGCDSTGLQLPRQRRHLHNLLTFDTRAGFIRTQRRRRRRRPSSDSIKDP